MTPLDVRRQIRKDLAQGLALALLLSLFVDVAILTVPLFDMQLYDRVLQSRNMDTLALLAVACVVGVGLYILLDYLRSACFIILAQRLDHQIAPIVLAEGTRRGAAGDRTAGPDMMRDAQELRAFLGSGAVAAPLDALCAPFMLWVLFSLHPAYGWLGCAAIAITLFVGMVGDMALRPRLLSAQAQRLQTGRRMGDRLRDADLVDGLGLLPSIGRRWAADQAEDLAQLRRADTGITMITGVSKLARLIVQAGVMVLGALLVIGGVSTPGSLMGANLMTNKMLQPFDHLISSGRAWMLARAAWTRLDTMLVAVPAQALPDPHTDTAGLLVKDVAYTPSNTLVLNNVSWGAEPGTLVLIEGANGAGKTSLLRLLAGLYPPSTGSISLNGSTIDPRQVGYLPQRVDLLDGSIADNIARFGDPDMHAVVEAARVAGIHHHIGRLPKGYDTVIRGQNDTALSGGMRQRLALARALYGSPALIVLDEPDANTDTDGSRALIEALQRARDRGAIVVVTSHRQALSLVADQTVRLVKGSTQSSDPVAVLAITKDSLS